jgi:hypothetical protein
VAPLEIPTFDLEKIERCGVEAATLSSTNLQKIVVAEADPMPHQKTKEAVEDTLRR